jgi:N-acetylneuraminate synthase
MSITEIDGIGIGRQRPYVIAEAGVNHEGSLERAMEMVDAAFEAGADMIKFQSYKAQTLASKHSPAYWDRSKEPAASQYELFKRHDRFGDREYVRLAEHSATRGIAFCSTPFDAHFVDLLAPLMPLFKIASADITNVPLLRRIASKGKPVALSTGASYLSEIDQAVRLLQAEGVGQIALLHCVLQYPTEGSNCHLRAIEHLRAAFPDVTVGWSDHVPPQSGCLSMLTAWMLGADILEKHFTLDKTLAGNDHYHAMDPDDLRAFRRNQQAVSSMLGEPRTTCLPCESEARKQARRSLVATVDIPAGAEIAADMLTAKRPAGGISPIHVDLVVGRSARRDLAADEVLQWDDVC